MNSPDEKELAKINEGRTAAITLRYTDAIFEEQRETAIAELCGAFRKGTLDLSTAFRLVGKIVSIDDLKNNLQSKANLAENLSKKRDLNAT